MKIKIQSCCQKIIVTASVVALLSCNNAESSTPSNTAENTILKTGQAPMKQTAVKLSRKCKLTNLDRSICMIEMMLADVSASYGWVSGGGVSEIRRLSSNSYQIILPQEERQDIFTYVFNIDEQGTVTVQSKTESTKSYR